MAETRCKDKFIWVLRMEKVTKRLQNCFPEEKSPIDRFYPHPQKQIKKHGHKMVQHIKLITLN